MQAPGAAMDDVYRRQVRLLVSVLPEIAKEPVFALKGGTAINLFYRDMPRLSVDIDLVYLPVEDRATSLRGIDAALDRIVDRIAKSGQSYRARRIAGGGDNDTRIEVTDGRARIKIETSPVLRGSVYPPITRALADSVTDEFGFAEMQLLAFEDLYASKLHAALDRKHPRDLFDLKLLCENEGLSDNLFLTFMVYVASSPRPMHELLAPPAADLDRLYDSEFAGMTHEPIGKEDLRAVEDTLQADIRRRLTGDTAAFLLSLHDGAPDFDRIGRPQAAALPAVRWKRINLEALKRNNPAKHADQRRQLEQLLW